MVKSCVIIIKSGKINVVNCLINVIKTVLIRANRTLIPGPIFPSPVYTRVQGEKGMAKYSCYFRGGESLVGGIV